MLSNNVLRLHAAAQYVLLFLALAVNSDWFQIYEVTCSYSNHPFLCTLVHDIYTKLSVVANTDMKLITDPPTVYSLGVYSAGA